MLCHNVEDINHQDTAAAPSYPRRAWLEMPINRGVSALAAELGAGPREVVAIGKEFLARLPDFFGDAENVGPL